MSPLTPPWKTAKPYFKRDALGDQQAHRPTWTKDQLDATIETIWYGDRALQTYYEARRNLPALPGFPAHMPHLPQFHYQPADIATARATRTLPPERDVHGAPVVAGGARGQGAGGQTAGGQGPVAGPPVAGLPGAAPPGAAVSGQNSRGQAQAAPGRNITSPGQALPDQSAVGSAQAASGQNVANSDQAQAQARRAALAAPTGNGAPSSASDSSASPLPWTFANHYTLDWWPPRPCHAEPVNDPTLRMAMQHIGKSESNKARFMNTRPYMWPEGDEHNWYGARFLGDGSYGCAGLWCQVDEYNNIISRTAVKEARPQHIQWRDPMYWRDRIPLEVRIHQRVDMNRPAGGGLGHDNLIEHRGYRLMMRQRRFRLYLNYYEGGDLSTSVDSNFELRAQGQEPIFENAEILYDRIHLDEWGNVPLIVPEGFIWWVFKSLVDACQVLHFGKARSTEGSKSDWQPITHLDIRMSNIFLQPRPARYDGSHQYPHVVLSDCGMSIYPISEGSPENPIEYVFNGHDARYAPEHRWMDDEDPSKLDSKTDVWQIACVIFELMANGAPNTWNGVSVANFDAQGQFVLEQMLWPAQGRMGFPMDGHVNAWRQEDMPTIYEYRTNRLPELVRRCLNWGKNLRPSLVELGNRIDDVLRAHPEWEGQGYVYPAIISEDNQYRMNATFPGRTGH